jgi:hypothetical protein
MFRHFIQRWNAVKEEKLKQNPHYPLLVPKVHFSNCEKRFLFFLAKKMAKFLDPLFIVLGLKVFNLETTQSKCKVFEITWYFDLVW